MTLRLVDLGLLLAFGLGDRRGPCAVGEVDLLLLLALGGRDHRALLALGGDLRLHRVQDLLRRREVLDLVAQDLHAPVPRRLVERRDDEAVDVVAFLEGPVELHAADHAPQRGLRELSDRHLEIARTVRCEPGIGDLEIQDAVHLQLRVVLGDADLARDVERDLAQIVAVGDAIDERDDEVEPRLEHREETPQPLDDEGVLLRHDADRARDDDDGDDEECDREKRRTEPHGECLQR